MTPGPRVVETADQRRLLTDVLAATDAGEPVSVLDPTWPAGLRRRARDDVDAAARDGRLRAGDLVLFTSGSTDRPRGVVRAVDSWRAGDGALTDILRLTRDDTVWLPGPLWSSLFLYGAWHASSVGARVLCRDDDPAESTVVHCVPAQLPGLLTRRAEGSLPRLGVVVVAGDRLPDGARGRVEGAGLQLVEYYGSAELSFVAYRDAGGPFTAFPGAEVAVRHGVIWSRSPFVMRHYLQPDDRGPIAVDADGWCTVGDLARTVPGGFEVLGRGATAVTTGGHTVVVEEVERVLLGVPGVTDVGVVGLPHQRLGAALVAVVVGDVDDETLRAAVRGLPVPSRPLRHLRAAAVPRTGGGKLRRQELIALAGRLAAQ